MASAGARLNDPLTLVGDFLGAAVHTLLHARGVYLGVAGVKVLLLLCTLPISDPRVSAAVLAEGGCAKVRELCGQVWEAMKEPIVWKPTVFLFIFAAKPGNVVAANNMFDVHAIK